MSGPQIPNQAHVYEAIRERNPWLPPPDFVVGQPGFTLNFGLNRLPSMNLEVFIEVPNMLINNRVHDFYEKQPEEHQENHNHGNPDDVTVSEERPIRSEHQEELRADTSQQVPADV